MSTFIDKLVFPAPASTYSRETFKQHLVWIPWNEAISPDKVDNVRFADGIPCVWLTAPHAAGVLLFCHGNAEDLGMCLAFLRHMRDQFKVNVLAVEYPGYGLLRALPVSEAALKEVALTAFRFIIDELKVAVEHIMLFGRSVGSGPAVHLASRFPIGGLILVAAFMSIKEVAKYLLGPLVACLLDERFPNIALIRNVSCPTLFIHGEKDTLIPPAHSVALFKQCRAKKLLVTPPGMDHNTNLFVDSQFLAIPAINFFGLPGYQKEVPPLMPLAYFHDGREAFLTRNHAKLKPTAQCLDGDERFTSVVKPTLMLCGCPASKVKGHDVIGMDHGQQCEWDAQQIDDTEAEVDCSGLQGAGWFTMEASSRKSSACMGPEVYEWQQAHAPEDPNARCPV